MSNKGKPNMKRGDLDGVNLKGMFPEYFDRTDVVRGRLMSKRQAALNANMSEETINTYIKKGYLEEQLVGRRKMIYYRDLLKASWKASGEGKGKNLPGKKER